MATYVTSDLHGYDIDRFTDFLEETGFGDNDTLYILGDVVDRGSDGIRYLWWTLTTPNVHLLLGNHEKMMLDCEFALEHIKNDSFSQLNYNQRQYMTNWLSNGGTPTLDIISRLLAVAPERVEQIFAYLKTLPLYAEITVGERDFVLVHGGLGGFDPDRPLADYLPFDLVWCRPAPTQRYYEDKTVILGHTPTECYGQQWYGRMFSTDTWLDIDTSCGHGGAPLLLRLDDMKEFYLADKPGNE